mgnify:CR=1 FL=1|tara:strand:- start:4834 stop:5403 length:570 start_codon:yes stop_codon:yes gene_type:complete
MRPYLLDKVADLGHAVFESGKYNLNIIGIRSSSPKSNKFDDRMCVVYKDDSGWVTRTWECTTDPGQYWLENPINVEGTAILVPGQYRGVYKIAKHQGKYHALCQRNGRVKVYRDNNRDDILDRDDESVMNGVFGINIHKAGSHSTQVDKWSAGCQVFSNESDFDDFMDICRQQIKERGWRTFTYTLIEG